MTLDPSQSYIAVSIHFTLNTLMSGDAHKHHSLFYYVYTYTYRMARGTQTEKENKKQTSKT